jgi:hypothetical protein
VFHRPEITASAESEVRYMRRAIWFGVKQARQKRAALEEFACLVSSPGVEFNLSELYYRRCFAEA